MSFCGYNLLSRRLSVQTWSIGGGSRGCHQRWISNTSAAFTDAINEGPPPNKLHSDLHSALQMVDEIYDTNTAAEDINDKGKEGRQKYTQEMDKAINLLKTNIKKEHRQSKYLKPTRARARARTRPVRGSYTFQINAQKVRHTLVPYNQQGSHKPPEIAHGLSRVLYQPLSLQKLRDNRSGMYNFDPAVENINPNFLEKKSEEGINVSSPGSEQTKPIFITPHRDESLLKVANEHKKKYISSSSSMTSILSQLHYLLSNFRRLNIIDSSISRNFPQKNCNYSESAYFPSTVILRKKKNGVCSIDSDRSLDREMVLSVLGHYLEDFLTKKSPNSSQAENYHYSSIDEFIVRSQLDAYDPNLPGTGVFDLKTRAVSAIRYDLSHVENNNNQTGYEIDRVYGEFESLEREYFELIRSALLKYSLQARIGKMDGIFVAYHNISKMFGFQYLPLDELDYIIHSSFNDRFDSLLEQKNEIMKGIYGEEEYILRYSRNDKEIASSVANREFKMSMNLFGNVLKHVEKLLNSNNTSWEKCKIMLKTEVEEKQLKNGRFFNEPVLNIIALPLSSGYEDKSLLVKEASNEQLTKELTNLRLYNENLLEERLDLLVGFKVNVRHFYHHHPSTMNLPTFASKKKDILDPDAREYISDIMKRDWYKDIRSTQTPNFFHASDVSTWEVSSTFTDIIDKQELRSLYLKYLDVKLNALKNQVITRQEPDTSRKDEIVNRIKNLQTRKKHSSNTSHKKSLNFGPSRLQTKLRAYAKKGAIRRNFLESSAKLHA
ncbi:hypothetical protein SUVZ_15G1670 [Saccharomyces uvarum]|uniref:Pet127p n=1 Tax=Saccharomyces uvarum TaxID=230603 RepID=A0ABN8WRU3_SACUV|nr:hypothetical protein SUVZ_15G1670 [Saccharomyces uvarum]